MSTVTPLIDHVDDLWPDGEPPGEVLDQLVLASHLLGANRAVSNFGGGNTSAKGTARDHTGREIPVMWVKGSGSDLATMGKEHFTALKLDEVLPLIERDEMSDEDMVAYLSRCQLDPRAPRCSIETLLHAFVPAPHVHHTHPDGINVLAGSADGERLVEECFGDSAAWIPYIRPGLHLVQAGRRGGTRQPGAEARRARQARARGVGRQRRGGLPPHDRGHRPGGRVRQRAHRRHGALRRPPPRGRPRPFRAAVRAAPDDPRRGLQREAQAPHRRHLAALAGVRLLRRRRDAGHRRGALPGPPRPHQAAAAVDLLRPGRGRRRRAARADRRARGDLPRRLPTSTSSATATTAPSSPTPTRESSSSSTSGWSPPARRRRRRRSRAICTTARSR